MLEMIAEPQKPVKQGPDFICFGLQKAGTQWLYDQMSSCGQVWMTPVKELNYFMGQAHKPANVKKLTVFLSKDEEQRASEAANQGFFTLFSQGKSDDLTWYRSLFGFKEEKISGDISPFYATADSADVQRIYAACPEAKYIFLLRHPVDRIWSALCMHARKGRVGTDVLKDWPSVKATISHKGYVKRSYPSQIWKRWTAVVPAGSIRHWFLDDIIADPERVRREVLAFVGIDHPEFSISADYNRKVGKQKIPMPDGVRAGLYQTFRQEIEDCAATFGGAALDWRR